MGVCELEFGGASSEDNPMIPAIGYMIGAYIILRCFDIWSRPDGSYRSSRWNTAMAIIAFLVMGWTILLMAVLLVSEISSL